MRVRRWGLLVGLLSLGVLGSACGSSAPTASGYPSTPRATVIAYYAAIGAHQWAAAERLEQPSQRALDRSAPDSDVNNTISVSHIDIRHSAYSGIGNPAVYGNEYRGYHDIWQVAMSYDAVYKKEITSPSGGQFRFIYLGRQNHTGRWTILEIGTGP